MSEQRRATDGIRRVGRQILALLGGSASASRGEMARAARVSPETVKRALDWLRDQGAPLRYEPKQRSWRLTKSFALPLSDPSLEDLQAVLVAAALLTELGLESAAHRAWALFNELGTRVQDTWPRPIRDDALRATLVTAIVGEPRWVLDLMRAARRQVVRVRYHSPWSDETATHVFEPWQVWLHDGVFYVRGFSRTRRAARTFHLANIKHLSVLAGERAHNRPPFGDLWAARDPRFGVDQDRPGTATIRLSGALARWVAGARWHPLQRDRWVDGNILERSLPYASCREFARRLASVADGLAQVDPPELRLEVQRILTAGTHSLFNA